MTDTTPYLYVIPPAAAHFHRSPLLKPLGLDAMQKYVGGLIQIIPEWDKFLGEPCIAFCNEEGKLRNLDLNFLATKYWHENVRPIWHRDVLVGTVIVITGPLDYLNSL